MKNRRSIILLSIFTSIAVMLSACAKKPSTDDRVLAAVSSKNITVGDFNKRLAKLPAYYQKIIEKDKKRYLDEVILERLMYEEAVREGLDRDKEVIEVLSEAKKKIVTAKFIKNNVEDKVNITDAEMKQFYEANKEQFKSQPMWRASHILVASQAEAQGILDELAKSGDFAEIAKVKSMDATASRGGDVGYFRSGQLIPDFEKECLKLKVGETSGIVHTQFGYHIIRMTDRKDENVKSFEESKRDIEMELKRQKRSELFNKLVLKLKDKYSVKIKYDVFETLGGVKKEAVKK